MDACRCAIILDSRNELEKDLLLDVSRSGPGCDEPGSGGLGLRKQFRVRESGLPCTEPDMASPECRNHSSCTDGVSREKKQRDSEHILREQLKGLNCE